MFRVPLQVAAPSGDRFVDVEAVVDTGASYTLLPSRLLVDLGVRGIERVRTRVADNRVVEMEIGEARLRLDGRERTVVVLFGPEDATPLLGATSLEVFGLAVDPMAQRLVSVEVLLLWHGYRRRYPPM